MAGSKPQTSSLRGSVSGSTGIGSTMIVFPSNLKGDLEMTSLASENYAKDLIVDECRTCYREWNIYTSSPSTEMGVIIYAKNNPFCKSKYIIYNRSCFQGKTLP